MVELSGQKIKKKKITGFVRISLSCSASENFPLHKSTDYLNLIMHEYEQKLMRNKIHLYRCDNRLFVEHEHCLYEKKRGKVERETQLFTNLTLMRLYSINCLTLPQNSKDY